LNKLLYLLFIILFSQQIWAQKSKKIVVEKADFSDYNQSEIPDAGVLIGNVVFSHEGSILKCNKAYLYLKENYIKAFGDVLLIQGDTITMKSKYAEYNGENQQAFSSGKVILQSPEMTLETDTLYFDRISQKAFYQSGGVIKDQENVLKSKIGTYLLNQKKYVFRNAVSITNPKYVIKTHHLDYFTNSGHAYLFGPSTITSKENFIYTEKGFYDTQKDVSHFLRKSYIKYNNRLIEGDSLFYNRNTEFASASRFVKITDSINQSVVKGHYAEVYRNQDSLVMEKKAVAMTLVEKDTLYTHGKKIIVTGKSPDRLIRAFPNVRFYKFDMSGKCDSLHSSEKTNLTKLIGRPVLWNFDNQMTGDIMHLISNPETEKLDSLKVLNNTFLVSKDTIGTGFNQVKGQDLFGRFENNQLREVDIIKNTEIIYYLRNDAQELIGINKSVCSKINILLDGNEIESIKEYKKFDGDIYPEADLPENARKLRGFIWRGDERIDSLDNLFPEEELIHEVDALAKRNKDKPDDNKPMEIRKETLEFDKPPSDSPNEKFP
jgi:lipopolysaccharide export system protein LptA